MKLKLSAAKLKTLTIPERKSGECVWDTSLPGFGVYVDKTAKTFLIQGR